MAGIEQLRPGLYRWTARHPAWQAGAEPGSAGDWGPEVGCVAFAIDRGIVVIDPEIPPDEAAFWAQMDALVTAAGGRVWVLQTIRWHGCSGPRFAERYDASCPADHGRGDRRDEAAAVPRGRRDDGAVDRLRELLMPLLDLPIELILVSHGEPVLAGGHARLRAALAA